LIEAITEPAKRQGYEITKDLLSQILEDVKQEPGFLPLLEFALTQLWERRDEAKYELTLDAYKAIDGIVGALNCHADKVYKYRDYEEDKPVKERTELEKVLIKRIFLNLLQIGDGEKDTRLRQPKTFILSLAGDNQEEQKVLTELIESEQGLVKGRLLVTGKSEREEEAWVDLAHEALIQEWDKLNVWRTENRRGRELAKQVHKDAQTWEKQKPDKSLYYLWLGDKLADAEKVLQEYKATVETTDLAKKFLQASSQQELRAYLRSPEVDNLDQKALEKEAANKSFLTKERLRHLLEDEREEAQERLAASWLLEQWGEEMPMRKAEVDGEGKILLRVIEEKLPTTVVEDLGNKISLELVEIPDGEFWMGSPEEEEGSYSDERPRHQFKVSPFLIGKYPVTQAQWRAVASLTQVERDLNLDPSYFKGDSRPVECVTWYEAVEFCERLSRLSQEKGKGYQYRLPSEAEWEYACRAGTETPFHFGKKISRALANYIEGARGRTTTVRRFQVANSYGLYDMHGNVWEWCEDDWHDNYEGAPTDGSAWLNEKDSQYKLLRGGSWLNIPDNCRSANRLRSFPDDRNNSLDFGLRVVVSPRT
jgi:formylglycine-generating enzyme required for sulfatase activity